jgi:hypothetical protein
MYGALVVLRMVRGLGFAAGILRTIWAVGGLSSLVGSVFVGPATRRLGLGPAMTLGWTLLGAALVGSLLGGLMGNTLGVRTTFVAGALGSFLSTFWFVMSPVTIAEPIPGQELNRVTLAESGGGLLRG